MDDELNPIETLFEKASEYGQTNYQLIRLKTIDKTSDILSSASVVIVIFIVVSTCLMFLNVAAALWLGDCLGKLLYGFLSVAAFYAFVGIILYAFCRKAIKTAVSNRIINHIMKK